ncbi:MAG: hypothetical protein ABL925_05875 [Methylococcales bacterium]
MNENERLLDDKKHIVSMRLNSVDRIAVRSTAERLFVRESELYRFAVNHLLNRLHKLQDESSCGSDLLPLFLELKDELNAHLNLKKPQLFQILNNSCLDAEKFVAMADIELLLLPAHALRQRLLQMNDAAKFKQADSQAWLTDYFRDKYNFADD